MSALACCYNSEPQFGRSRHRAKSLAVVAAHVGVGPIVRIVYGQQPAKFGKPFGEGHGCASTW